LECRQAASKSFAVDLDGLVPWDDEPPRSNEDRVKNEAKQREMNNHGKQRRGIVGIHFFDGEIT
jgi:hypothetical protein